jgi:putative redox protein
MTTTSAPPKKPPTIIRATWDGEHRFDVSRPGGVTARIDASGVTGPGPVDMLLGALATCATVDVVDILAKRRTPAERLSVSVMGERAQSTPARLTRVLLEYVIDGAGIDREAAERAVDLSLTKYCTVRASLDPAIGIMFAITLNGQAGTPRATGTAL